MASHPFASSSGSTGEMCVFLPLYSHLCPANVSSSTSHGSTRIFTPACSQGNHAPLMTGEGMCWHMHSALGRTQEGLSAHQTVETGKPRNWPHS